MQQVYLDNAATTPTDAAVVEVISNELLNNWGNASSLHGFGRRARATLDEARHINRHHSTSIFYKCHSSPLP